MADLAPGLTYSRRRLKILDKSTNFLRCEVHSLPAKLPYLLAFVGADDMNWSGLRLRCLGALALCSVIALVAPATSKAAGYTLSFSGTVTDSALGASIGDSISGTVTANSFNADTFTPNTDTPGNNTNEFLQDPLSFTFHVSHQAGPGSNPFNLDIRSTADGRIDSGRIASLMSNELVVQVFGSPGLILFYTTIGKDSQLSSLANLPSTSNSVIALLGGGSPSAIGKFSLGDQAIGFSIAFAATPIPASLPLFASGLCGLGFVGWRRRKIG